MRKVKLVKTATYLKKKKSSRKKYGWFAKKSNPKKRRINVKKTQGRRRKMAMNKVERRDMDMSKNTHIKTGKNIEKIHSRLNSIEEQLRELIARGSESSREVATERSQGSESSRSGGFVNDEEHLVTISRLLTDREKKIVLWVIDRDDASYNDVAIAFGMTPIAVKKHFNNMGMKGFPLKFRLGQRNEKRYYLESSIKKVIKR